MNTIDQIRLESFCAGKIRYESDAAKRLEVYADAYNLFFENVGDHPQFDSPDDYYYRHARKLVNNLAPLIASEDKNPSRILEFGCGRGFLTAELARRFPLAECIGVDVALDAMTIAPRNNLSFVKANVLKLEPLVGEADLVVADQVLEHFHAEDADLFIGNCARNLKTGGYLFISTPNKVWGPHDVSGLFNLKEPVGFHIVEYSAKEVIEVCRKNGFRFECAIISPKGHGKALSVGRYVKLERFIGMVPYWLLSIMRERRLLGWANIKFLFRKI